LRPRRSCRGRQAHVWHHLIQHKPFETKDDPRIIVEGRGMRVWDATGKEHLDAVSGGVWTVNVGYGRESIANAVRDQLVKMNYFANSGFRSRARCSPKTDRENAGA
jgi:taurine-pyruvate aminotransferase